MNTLKYNTFEELQADKTVRVMIEQSSGVEIEVIGITFFVRDAGEAVKVYQKRGTEWLYAGKYNKNR